jgi:DNA mismatch endonuclease (patch repair protein)
MERILSNTLPNGRFVGVTRQRSLQMAAVKSRGNNTTERALRFALVRSGIRGWELEPKDVLGRPDFFFRAVRVAVFVDGCFWHGCARCGHFPRTNSKFWRAKLLRNRERDKLTSRRLKSSGLRVIRFWEHQLAADILGCLRRIQSALDEER